MKPIILLFCLSVISAKLFATAQYPDKIIYQGKEYNLDTNPLEPYFEKNPDKRPKGGMMSTALWRGYVATFEIRDGQFFLKDIQIEVPDATKQYSYKWQSVMDSVFKQDSAVKIDWFSGLLVMPYGKLVNYVHMGYGSTYEKYILVEVANGDFKKEKRFKYKEYADFKQRQFEAFKNTDEYKKLKADLQKDNKYDDAFIDDFLKNFVVSYSSKILVE